jgi:uncharacterized membrane protein YtjA (UPF0391 family)
VVKWALVFLAVGLISGLLGFTGATGTSFTVPQLLLLIAATIFVVLLALGVTLFRKAA